MELPWVYLDTSTYIKLYIKEKGSEEARNLVRNGRIISSNILLIESFSALSRKKHGREIDEKVFKNLIGQMKADLQYIEIVRLTDKVLRKAEEVVLHSDARALDAIHIASALIFREGSSIKFSFVTSDRKQQEVAKENSFKTVFVG